MNDVVIASSARTGVGSFGRCLASVPAAKLGETVIRAAMERAGVNGDEVSETIEGHELEAVQGQNTARQASIGGGMGIAMCVES